jgi:hypothetical protein
LEFERTSPLVIRSTRQPELLNGWLALCACNVSPLQLEDYGVERLDDEKPDRALYHRPTGRIPPSDLIEFG